MSNRTTPINEMRQQRDAAASAGDHATALTINDSIRRLKAGHPSLQACVRENNTVDMVQVVRLARHKATVRGKLWATAHGVTYFTELRRVQVEAQHLAATRRERAEMEAANARRPLRDQLVGSLKLELEIAERGLSKPLDHDRIARIKNAIAAAEAVL